MGKCGWILMAFLSNGIIRLGSCLIFLRTLRVSRGPWLFILPSILIIFSLNLIINLCRYPEKELLHCLGREVVESHFMSCMKEADILKHKSPIFSTMQRKDHTQLWLGLQNGLSLKQILTPISIKILSDKFDQFWAVNRKLMEGDDTFKYIPFRWYFDDDPYSQKLIRSVNEDRHAVTLLDLIQLMLPNADANKRNYQNPQNQFTHSFSFNSSPRDCSAVWSAAPVDEPAPQLPGQFPAHRLPQPEIIYFLTSGQDAPLIRLDRWFVYSNGRIAMICVLDSSSVYAKG